MSDIGPLLALGEEQRRANLELAVETRQDRAVCKRNLRDGFISFDEFLDRPCNRRMRVNEALRAVPGIGGARAADIMAGCGISPHRRVGGLGCRQREALLEAVCDFRRDAAERMRGDPTHPAHGTLTGYVYGCRCERCRAANAGYHRAVRGRERARDELYTMADKYHEPWSAEEDAALAALYPTRTAGEVAHMLGRTTSSVRARIHKLGIRKDMDSEGKQA